MNTRIDGASCQIIPDDLYTSGEPSLNRLAAAAVSYTHLTLPTT